MFGGALIIENLGILFQNRCRIQICESYLFIKRGVVIPICAKYCKMIILSLGLVKNIRESWKIFKFCNGETFKKTTNLN